MKPVQTSCLLEKKQTAPKQVIFKIKALAIEHLRNPTATVVNQQENRYFSVPKTG